MCSIYGDTESLSMSHPVKDSHNSCTVGATVSPPPQSFWSGVHLGFPESHRPADFEIGDESGHAPAVEVAFADPVDHWSHSLRQAGGYLPLYPLSSLKIHADAENSRGKQHQWLKLVIINSDIQLDSQRL